MTEKKIKVGDFVKVDAKQYYGISECGIVRKIPYHGGFLVQILIKDKNKTQNLFFFEEQVTLIPKIKKHQGENF